MYLSRSIITNIYALRENNIWVAVLTNCYPVWNPAEVLNARADFMNLW
jgi:pyruvate-formate lyase-activating enzyme